jgi:periplasmic protein CpxP/Spy
MRHFALKYTVVAALLINTATLIFFWSKRQEEKPTKKPFEVLIEALKLSNAQQETYKNLREEHRDAHAILLKRMAVQRKSLYSQKQTANDTIIHNIGLLHEEIELLTYHHFEDVRKICTPEQQVTLDSVLAKTVQNILQPLNKKRHPRGDREN